MSLPLTRLRRRMKRSAFSSTPIVLVIEFSMF